MSSLSPFDHSIDSNMRKTDKRSTLILAGFGIGVVLMIITLAIAIATLVKVNQQTPLTTATSSSTATTATLSSTAITATSLSTATSTVTGSLDSTLAASIHIDDVMYHLRQFQQIATANNETRAVSTPGFNQTLDYITNTLTTHTNYNVSRDYFNIRQFALAKNPILISSINGVTKNYTYSTDLSVADFYHIQFSTGANFSDFLNITAIPNVGCTDDDWAAANPPAPDRVVLVKRGVCPFADKGLLAAKYNATAILIYNDGTDANRLTPIAIGLGQENAIPALFLSFAVGQELANAAQNASLNAGIQLIIEVEDLPLSPIGNICADTPTGDITQTIIIGSHSDSVPAGPGINDNGSGSAANLGLALALHQLFQTSTYEKYKYRIRFCWWGAEEIGLLGAEDHVKKAENSTVPGERISDYLINLNFDMLGSPNFIFGIYNGNTSNNDTPPNAIPGSIRVTTVFKDWFDRQNLPSDYTSFDGRSDYGPFLAAGIAAGGLFSGADGKKTQEQRDRYDGKLGQGMGGIVDALYDPCYHLKCDSIQNINVVGYEKMVQAAAYMLEYLARKDDLKTWLYPNGGSSSTSRLIQRKYNSINQYFQMPDS